jgi:methyl-accepting chemotaxis protein
LVALSGSCSFVEIVLSFSGLPASSAAEDTNESEHDHSRAVASADTLQSAPGLDTMSAIVDNVVQLSNPVESALNYAESLASTLECLNDAVKYINGVIELVQNFSDVRSHNTTVSKLDRSLLQIHPISKVAVGALTKVYDVRILYMKSIKGVHFLPYHLAGKTTRQP